jgi:flagellar hook-length control protein FliK
MTNAITATQLFSTPSLTQASAPPPIQAPPSDGFGKALGQARTQANKPAQDAAAPAKSATKDANAPAAQSTNPANAKNPSTDASANGDGGSSKDASAKDKKQDASTNGQASQDQSQADGRTAADSATISANALDASQTLPKDPATASAHDPATSGKTRTATKQAADPTAIPVAAQPVVTPIPQAATTDKKATSSPDTSTGQTAPVNPQATQSTAQQANAISGDAVHKGKEANFQQQAGNVLPAGNGTDSDGDGDTSLAADVKSADDAVASHSGGKADVSSSAAAGQFNDVLQAKTAHANTPVANATLATPAPTTTPDAQNAVTNRENIVSGIRGQLLPDGGTMHIRLDPPELGAVQVSVKIENGVVSATFQTNNDNATKMLSHSLGQLKAALESQGVSVDRLHVQQSPKSETPSGNTDDSGKQQSGTQERGSQQDEQRREVLRRMWRRVAGGGDPLDLVA